MNGLMDEKISDWATERVIDSFRASTTIHWCFED